MQIIDFINGKGYRVINFPDGEVHLQLDPLNRKEGVIVKCRITNATELFLLMQLSDILKRQCIEVSILEIYYLMGMRCDRLFDINRSFTLSIVADVVNSLKAETVYIYEPHSVRCLKLIHNSINTLLTWHLKRKLIERNKGLLLVAPDKGSINRYGDRHFAVVCDKVRDEASGELQGFRATPKEDVAGCDLLVIDDLCDGGGTFVGLAPKLRELNPNTLSLLVTHAIQKQGIEKVAAVYNKVYITDSYKDWAKESLPANVTVFKIDELNAI